MKSAVITGITGQDGAYLAEYLLTNNYKVYGSYRRASSVNFWRLEEIGVYQHPNLTLVESDLTDPFSSIRLIEQSEPQEVYNLAAQSFVSTSFEQPVSTANITALGALNMLEAIRVVNPKIRFYQASSSEMFGKVNTSPQNESTPFYPRSPYGVAKLYAHWLTINYRESYDIFACSGILFNHESPLRGQEFVTRKISNGLARIMLGKQDYLELGNLDAKRDWGYAKEYVQGIWKMLQIETPDNFVLATNITTTVRDFTNICAEAAGFDLIWEGVAENEVGIDADTGKVIVRVNPKFYRPAEVDILIGDYSKAYSQLNWQPDTTVELLAQMMVEVDIQRNKVGKSY